MDILYDVASAIIRVNVQHVRALGRYYAQLQFAKCTWLLILFIGFNQKALNTPIYMKIAASVAVILYIRLNSLKDQETDSSKNNGTEDRTRKEH